MYRERGPWAGVWTLSAAMLVFELALTRLLALAQFYHFAFMVVSLALLGIGASGTLLCLRPSLARRSGSAAAGFAALVLCSLAVLRLWPFDSYAVAWDRWEAVRLLVTVAAATCPFVCAGLVIGGMLAEAGPRRHRLYAANLAGSAGGSLGALPLLAALGGEATLVVAAGLGLLSAAMLVGRDDGSEPDLGVSTEAPSTWLPRQSGSLELASGSAPATPLAPRPLNAMEGKRNASTRLASVTAAGLLLALAWARPGWMAVTVSAYKALPQALQAPDAHHTVSKWDLAGRVDVVESPSIHVLPGLSEQAPIAVPPRQAGLTVDGDDLSPITALSAGDPEAGRLADHVPEALAAHLRPGGRVLVLEPAGGWVVLTALAGGARQVTAVERNPTIAAVVRRDYADFTFGLYDDPRVRLEVADPRAALRRAGPAFDVVFLALDESFHPVTSGAFGLAETYGNTVEALTDALSRLTPDGLLVVTRWLQTPPTESLRALANLQVALSRRGVERPGDHLAAIRSLRTVLLVASPTPLGGADRANVRRFVDERGYDLVWLPDMAPDEANRHQRLPRPLDAEAFAALLADPNGFVAGHEYDIRPTTDNRPFFHHYFRWGQTPAVMAGLGRTWQPFGGSGYLVLVALLGVAVVLAAALLLIPLMARPGDWPRPHGGPAGASATPAALPADPAARPAHPSDRPLRRPAPIGRAVGYFGALGVGYVFIVVPLSQGFILYLGQAVTALGAVLAAVLLFAGLGSLTAPRWGPRRALALLGVVAALTPSGLDLLVDATLTWPLPARVVLSLLVLAPLGTLLGVPFARGLLLFEERIEGVTAWAWAANGCASVVAGVAAAMLALGFGFDAVVWCGATAYAGALAMLGRPHPRDRQQGPPG